MPHTMKKLGLPPLEPPAQLAKQGDPGIPAASSSTVGSSFPGIHGRGAEPEIGGKLWRETLAHSPSLMIQCSRSLFLRKAAKTYVKAQESLSRPYSG